MRCAHCSAGQSARSKMRSLVVLLAPLSALAQVLCSLGPGAASYQASNDQRPSRDAMQIAGRVNAAEKAICADHCPEVQLVRNSTAPNATLIANSGQAKLAYSPQFFAAVYAGYGDAGLVAVIAHELGHALDDSIGAAWIKSDWTPELRADAWAGCTLAKSNLKPSDMHAALGALAKYPSPAHPAWNLRVPAIRSGYTHCGGEPASFDSGSPTKKTK